MSTHRRILFLSVATETREFDCYDMARFTTPESTDLVFWTALHGIHRDTMEYVNAADGEAYPPAAGFRGIIVGGSMYSSYENRPWQLALKRYLRDAVRLGVPVLGVCGGHQLMIEALGGSIAPHPRGHHVGAFALRLTTDGRNDPLFEGVDDGELVQCVHGDVAASLPRGAISLARTAHDGCEAVRYSAAAVSTQFHLEFSSQAVEHLMRHYDSSDHAELGQSADTAPVQRRLFSNWLNQLQS